MTSVYVVTGWVNTNLTQYFGVFTDSNLILQLFEKLIVVMPQTMFKMNQSAINIKIHKVETNSMIWFGQDYGQLIFETLNATQTDMRKFCSSLSSTV